MKYGRYETTSSPINSDGGMGRIYSGWDPKLHREVCIKVIHPELAQDKSYQRRFKREAILMAQLKHDHIVSVYDYGVNGDAWIAMEMLDGHPLSHANLPFNFLRSAKVFLEIAKALHYCHEEGIAHCDVKPGNIMDSNNRFVLIDFGIGFRDGIGIGDAAKSGVRNTGGTAAYAPPEQTVGEPVPLSDVYSLGCTIYQLFVGEKPFPGKSRVAIANKHLSSRRPYIRHGPKWFADLVVKCMSIQIYERPTPQEIIDVINDNLLSGTL